jgi:hypothetical protein
VFNTKILMLTPSWSRCDMHVDVNRISWTAAHQQHSLHQNSMHGTVPVVGSWWFLVLSRNLCPFNESSYNYCESVECSQIFSDPS